MSNSGGGDRNWADLPADLIGSIVELVSTVDYLRFGAVCTSWAASVSLFLPRAPQMPFLLISSEERYTLLDLTDGRRHRRPFPELEGRMCIDSQADGWLALVDGRRSEMSLFNPVTRSEIQLPSITNMDGVKPIYNYRGSLKQYRVTILSRRLPQTVTPDDFRNLIKVAFSRPTAGSNPIAAVVLLLSIPLFATATGKWILIRDAGAMSDVINYGGDGRFLMTSVCGKLWALDVTVTTTGDSPKLTELTKNIEYPFSTNQGQNIYLANSNGDILLTVIAKKWAGLLHHVEIFRFESDQQCWVPLRGGLGDRSLFVGSCSSFSLSARQVPELKPNCVYCQWIEEGVTSRFGRFHLEDGSVDYFSYPPKRWWDSFPLPLWFAPSLL